jgi:hypothetical protein
MDGLQAAAAYSQLYKGSTMSEEATTEQPIQTEQSPTIAKLAAALCKAQSQMEGAKKNSSNPHFKNSYADLESVWDACRKPLTDNGLAVIQAPEGEGDHVVLETMLVHNSGEFISRRLPIRPTKQDPQGVGSAITYARRYALMAMVGLAPEDDDGEAASGRGSTKQPTYKPDDYPDAKQAIEDATTLEELQLTWGRLSKEARHACQSVKDKRKEELQQGDAA